MKKALLALLALTIVAGCAVKTDNSGGNSSLSDADPGNCTVVDMAVSSEKIQLLTELARTFNGGKDNKVDGKCVFVRPASKASGSAMQALADGWNTSTDGPRPVIWSPASSAWAAILNQRLATKGEKAMAVKPTPFMLTPLVIAMPRPMAEALGWPGKALGWSDILALARSDQGWAAYGHPEWGPFRLGKTNPNFSTSGLSALIAQAYAATGKTSGLSHEDLARPETIAFASGVESAVVHYGDITMTFLNNWFRNDQRGSAFTYASAVAVEEKSVIDYNLGNPDGVLQPGEQPRKPRVPLVSIYPKEGTLYSDNPFIVLDAPWVSATQRKAALKFQAFVQRPENQRKVLASGFRPGNPDVAVGSPVTKANGVDPNEPKTLLEVPSPPVMVELLDRWAQQRKGARVLLVVDVSGSMGDKAASGSQDTKLDLAKRAAIDALDQFKPDDEVGLRIFTTGLGQDQRAEWLDLLPFSPIGQQREALRSKIDGLYPRDGTPLYDVTLDSYKTVLAGFTPDRINAVVLLTDGKNDDGEPSDDSRQLDELITSLRAGSEGGQSSKPVRVFPIAYGGDADLTTLRRIAEATNAAAYDASDPTTITKVFTAVVSNF